MFTRTSDATVMWFFWLWRKRLVNAQPDWWKSDANRDVEEMRAFRVYERLESLVPADPPVGCIIPAGMAAGL